jgi:hypothetical protein
MWSAQPHPALFTRGGPVKRLLWPARVHATSIVLAHFLVALVHGATHAKLAINLDFKGAVFVWLVVGLAPLIAMMLLWTFRYDLGLMLLAFAMTGSLLFGLYHHFLAPGPDHVGSQVGGPASGLFVASAYGLLVSEGLGACCGLYYLLRLGVAGRHVCRAIGFLKERFCRIF